MDSRDLMDRLAAHGDRIFLTHMDRTRAYSDLNEEIDRVSLFLRQEKIEPGSVVAILSDYSLTSIALLLALFRDRHIVVPIATHVREIVAQQLEEAYVDYTVTIDADRLSLTRRNEHREKHGLIRALTGKGNAGLVLFSSGTTGRPKAMIHNLDRLMASYRDKRARNMVILAFLMYDHIGGLNTLFNVLAHGAHLVVPGTRDPDLVCGLIEKQQVTVLPTTPTFLNLILISEAYKRHEMRSLRLVTYGTEPMPANLLTRLKSAFPRVRFIQTFGTSETGIVHTASKSSASPFLRLDDPDIEHKIVDGKLWLRGKTQILGYLNAGMESFTEDGWFKTGDRVAVDEDGFIQILGRSGEMINVGGEKVMPQEVEDVLMAMPEILDCTVYGEKNAITGHSVSARIVTRATDHPSALRRKIRGFCREKLESYKIPTRIKMIDPALTGLSESVPHGRRFKKIRPASGS